jgi:sulfate/thiosulfate transport system permease protein
MSTSVAQPNFRKTRPHRVLPGFGLSLGTTILYLSLIVLIPLATLFWKSSTLGWHRFVYIVSDPEAVAAYKLSFGESFLAAFLNLIFGFIVAWVLGRYSFPGRRLLDAIVDLPFALPTAVAGIALAAVYDDGGIIGKHLYWYGLHLSHARLGFHPFLSRFKVHVDYTPLGILVALVFIGLPYVVRTIQPVLEDLESEVEEAAASLGASRAQTFIRVIFPTLAPCAIAGFSLAFARALGEYGSVIFISNNVPFEGEIVPKLIVDELSNFNYAGATALAVVMLLVSFTLLLLINTLQRWSARHQATS